MEVPSDRAALPAVKINLLQLILTPTKGLLSAELENILACAVRLLRWADAVVGLGSGFLAESEKSAN
jgi:hypothetical protein